MDDKLSEDLAGMSVVTEVGMFGDLGLGECDPNVRKIADKKKKKKKNPKQE